jgi:hypothetical protein
VPDIQAKIDSLVGKIGDALERLLTLKVETLIGEMDVVAPDNDKENWTLVPKPGAATVAIKTTIRLSDGDIKNAMTEQASANAKLVELHWQQVAASRQIVSDNLKGLMDLAQSLAKNF